MPKKKKRYELLDSYVVVGIGKKNYPRLRAFLEVVCLVLLAIILISAVIIFLK